MEKLKIFNHNSEDDNFIYFYEALNRNDNFTQCFLKVNKNEIKLLDYRSLDYNYYIHEAKDGEHTIYRSKK